MIHHGFQRPALCSLVIGLSGICFATLAQVSTTLINSTNASIDTLRKRNCVISVTAGNGSSVAGAAISVKQVRHDFAFGAAIPFSILSDTNLQKVFLSHYEWAVFENDLKWPSTDTSAAGPDYSRPDSLLDFCVKNDIKVRGHNLFWNQDSSKLPAWTLKLNTTDFKAAVDKRIANALTHYKGKIPQWDIGNEVIHGTQLETRTGSKTIWNYIFDKSRQTDAALKLAINDFNIIEQYSDLAKYIRKIDSIRNPATGTKGPIDIIGLEGHFGGTLTQTDYKAKLDQIGAVGLPLWLTEVDFTVATNVRANKFEELIRTAFAHPKVAGFMMWTFWGGNLWRNTITSYIADSATYAINDLGVRYESLMKLWTTTASGTTDATGKYSFKGFQGKYVVTTTISGTTQIDTVYLEPGAGTKSVSITSRATGIRACDANKQPTAALNVRINGKPVLIISPGAALKPLFASVYSTSGRRLSRRQIDLKSGGELFPGTPKGCCIYTIDDAKKTLFTTRGLNLGR